MTRKRTRDATVSKNVLNKKAKLWFLIETFKLSFF
jgi:hypothetical protein